LLKFLFFDKRDYEVVKGFERKLERPRKRRDNPSFVPDAPWEKRYMCLYGSVARRSDGVFQLWYTIGVEGNEGSVVAYAESDDGIEWRRPRFDIYKWRGRKTNVVFTEHPHGATVLLDEADPDPDRRYKMLCGASPTGRISAFVSPDGVRWRGACHNPVIPSNPDCPMSLHRQRDGRYVLYVRREWGDRRVSRSESWDFEDWTPRKRVLEPGPGDPAQLQFYGMGAAQYGAYEIGTLWMYHTVTEDTGWAKMRGYQEAELTYCRDGYCWHRAAQGEPFIPHGRMGTWEQGNLQCASSPLFLADEIRFYYAAGTRFHGVKVNDKLKKYGLGLAVAKPDRFVGLHAASRRGEIVSRIFVLRSPEMFVNADVKSDGDIVLEMLDADWKPIPGFRSQPIVGSGTALEVNWSKKPRLNRILRKPIRFRLRARNAKVYSVWMRDGDEQPVYHRFRAPGFVNPAFEIDGPPAWW